MALNVKESDYDDDAGTDDEDMELALEQCTTAVDEVNLELIQAENNYEELLYGKVYNTALMLRMENCKKRLIGAGVIKKEQTKEVPHN